MNGFFPIIAENHHYDKCLCLNLIVCVQYVLGGLKNIECLFSHSPSKLVPTGEKINALYKNQPKKCSKYFF